MFRTASGWRVVQRSNFANAAAKVGAPWNPSGSLSAGRCGVVCHFFTRRIGTMASHLLPFAESNRTGDKLRAKWGEAKRRFSVVMGVVQQRGDGSWNASTFNLSNWTGMGKARRICWKCKADKTDCPYTDVSARAKWRSSPAGIGED